MARYLLRHALMAGALLGYCTPVAGGESSASIVSTPSILSIPSTPTALLDDFLGALIADLKAELLVAREAPKMPTVPAFKLSAWAPAPGASHINSTFENNPHLLAARAMVARQVRDVARLRNNASEATATLSAALASIREQEAELHKVSALISASEAREQEVQRQTVERERDAEKAKIVAEGGVEVQEKERMAKLEARIQREVATETTEYNEALHHVLANAGAVLHQQEHVLNEKKTVLQEAADRAELPEVVDFVGSKLPGMVKQVYNVSASQKAVKGRLAKLQEEIKETLVMINRLDGKGGSAQEERGSSNATAAASLSASGIDAATGSATGAQGTTD